MFKRIVEVIISTEHYTNLYLYAVGLAFRTFYTDLRRLYSQRAAQTSVNIYQLPACVLALKEVAPPIPLSVKSTNTIYVQVYGDDHFCRWKQKTQTESEGIWSLPGPLESYYENPTVPTDVAPASSLAKAGTPVRAPR